MKPLLISAPRLWIWLMLILCLPVAAMAEGGWLLSKTPVTSATATQSNTAASAQTAPKSVWIIAPVSPEVKPASARSDAAGNQRLERTQRPEQILMSGPTVITTGFAGKTIRTPRLDPGLSDAEREKILQEDKYKFIDPDGTSAALFDASEFGFAFNGSERKELPYDTLLARDIGQVFGIAIDEADAPNLYLTATSAFGLNIVGDDTDNDEVPDRLKNGAADARWMSGQWGGFAQSGPGSVYKVDGETGQISHFATIGLDGRQNSGAALGNIVYDPLHRQLFVSDLETGMIHRLSMDGDPIDRFDHGVSGRPRRDLEPVTFDPETGLVLTSRSFVYDDPTTWNMADPERRVWGMAMRGERLFYAVAAGPEVWSVGLDRETGAFLDDPRWEFTLSDDHPDFDISDMVFANDGTLFVSQRGRSEASFDYERLAAPEEAEVLRFVHEYPEDDPATPSVWEAEPALYPVGFASGNKNGNGGVALGPAYDEEGKLNTRFCEATLWATGDQLRVSTSLREVLERGGDLNLNGMQASPSALPLDSNAPPWLSYHQDYDGEIPEQSRFGQMGDTEVLGCGKGARGNSNYFNFADDGWYVNNGGGGGNGSGCSYADYQAGLCGGGNCTAAEIAAGLCRGGGCTPAMKAAGLCQTGGCTAEEILNGQCDGGNCTTELYLAGLCHCSTYPGGCGPDPESCEQPQSAVICNPVKGVYELALSSAPLAASGFDRLRLSDPGGQISALPGTAVVPGQVRVDLSPMVPGQAGQVEICAYDQTASNSGRPYACCRSTVVYKIPGQPCIGGASQ